MKNENIVRIDAHQHFWTTQRRDYGWLTPALVELYQDFQPNDLTPLLIQHGFKKSVVIQAAATVAETEYLLSLASQHDVIAGVVGWVDMLAADASHTLVRLAKNIKFKGIRPMLQELKQDDWISSNDHAQALDGTVQTLLQQGLSFDALVYSRHLPYLSIFARRYPALPIVLDHAAKPGIANSEWQPWAEQIQELAKLPNVMCKLSGLVTEASADWTHEHLQRYVNHLLENFGAERLMWGSDWPVVNMNGSYSKWYEVSEILLNDLTEAQSEAVFGGNAMNFYRIAE